MIDNRDIRNQNRSDQKMVKVSVSLDIVFFAHSTELIDADYVLSIDRVDQTRHLHLNNPILHHIPIRSVYIDQFDIEKIFPDTPMTGSHQDFRR